MNSSSSLLRERERERENENENENERAAIFRIGRKTTFQQRNAIKSLPLTLKTPIISIATKRRGVFLSRKVICTKQQKTLLRLQKERADRGHTTRERPEEKNAKRRTFCVGSFSRFPRFLRHFFLLFSLFVRRVCWSFSLFSNKAHLPSPSSDRLPQSARCSSWVSNARERKRRNNKGSVAIINTNNNKV